MEISVGSNGYFHWIQRKFPLDPMEIYIGSNGNFHWIQWKFPLDPMEISIGLFYIWVPRDPLGWDTLGGPMGPWDRWDLGTDGTWASRTPDTSSSCLLIPGPAQPGRPARPARTGTDEFRTIMPWQR